MSLLITNLISTMKKITTILMFTLSIMIAYFTATGVNLHYLDQIGAYKENKIYEYNFVIKGVNNVDRIELIDELMNVADKHSLLLTAGWVKPDGNEFYYYGDSQYLKYTLVYKLVRTEDNVIKIDDKNLSINSYEDGTYGRIYTVGNLPSRIHNFAFYSFERMKNNLIALDFRVQVSSINGEKSVELATQDLSQHFPELKIIYVANNGITGESEFSWNDSIGNYLVLSLIFVFLLVVFSMLIVIRKQQRYIAICRFHGISSRQIALELFGPFLLILFIIFLVGTTAFDYVVVGNVAHYNLLFYQIQLITLGLVVFVLWATFEIANLYIKRFNTIESIKTRTLNQEFFFGGLALKFVLVVLLLSNYMNVYHGFIESYRTYNYYNENIEEFSRISYIAGSMPMLSVDETGLITNEVYSELQSMNADVYCVDLPISSDSLGIATLRGLDASVSTVNQAFVNRYLPSIALALTGLDSKNEPIIIVPKVLQNKEKKYQDFLINLNLSGTIRYVDKIPDVPIYFGLPISYNNLILYVDDRINEYTGPKIMYPCYILEENAGSKEIINSALAASSHPDWLVAYSNEINIKRNIQENKSMLIDYGIQIFLSLSIVITFFMMMLVLYLYTNLKLITIKKNHGQSDLQVFSYFFAMNAIVYGGSLLYLVLKGTFDWVSLSILVFLIILEYLAIKIYLFVNKKNFKQWLS